MAKILLVDDYRPVREILALSISDAFDHEIIQAVDGIDGVQKFKDHHPEISLIISDCSMPNMRGPEMLKVIIEMGYQGTILMISGNSCKDVRQELIHFGIFDRVSDFLEKPFNINILPEIIQKHLN